MPLTRTLILATVAASFGLAAWAADISGAGATFPYPIYSKWADTYKKDTGIGLNYQSIGSGGGIRQIQAKTVTFGASDMPLKPADLIKSGLLQFPAIVGGAVPVVNVKGIGPGELLLDGPTIASIYLGEITMWNDARIQKLNPRVALPATAIAPVYRADGSGTNFLFTNYLSRSSPEFAQKIGSSTSVQWPVGIGAKGNEGVANMTVRTDGAIGYVEFAYALQNHMAYAKLKNRDGRVVAPSEATFQAAAANADWAHADHYYVVLTDQPGAQSWPITGASFILVYSTPPDPAATAQALKFFAWAFHNGAQMAQALDYVPLPTSLVRLIENTWRTQIHAHGAPVWTG